MRIRTILAAVAVMLVVLRPIHAQIGEHTIESIPSGPALTGQGEWTWVGGSSTGDQLGVYGQLGVAAAGNVPASRTWAASWTDPNGNLWLFAGEGFDATNMFGDLNDLWEFNPVTGEWAWISGSKTDGQPGVYGTLGAPGAGNVPGARDSAATWTDASGDLWLFGGSVDIDSDTLNDLWRFDLSTHEWTWMGGSSGINQAGVYGTLSVPAAGNVPGARSSSVTWTDPSGNFWLFGGVGTDGADKFGYLNDLWKFNPATHEWAWMSGSGINGQAGVYGTLGVAATGNAPGGREEAVGWTDRSGNLWLFGGGGFDSAGSENTLNDLWEFNPSTRKWTWMSGSNVVGQTGVYGTLGVASAGNVPGPRDSLVAWTGENGDLWLFGGFGYFQGWFNDLWMFDPSTREWTWMGGSSEVNQPGVYGTLGVPAADNIPEARYSGVGWTGQSGNFWLFGGDGPQEGVLNDLWEYGPAAAPSTAATPVFSPAAGTYASPQTVTITDGTPGATIYYTTDGSTPSASSSKFSGSISVASTKTIEAIAVAPGYQQSLVATGTYAIVAPGTTTVALTSSPNPSMFGHTVSFTATVTGSAAAPTGAVSFLDGTSVIGTAMLAPGSGLSSTADFATSSLAVGTHPITANYTAASQNGGLSLAARPSSSVHADTFAWTKWSLDTPGNATPGSASGTLVSTRYGSIHVTYSGQTSGLATQPSWAPASTFTGGIVGNAPPPYNGLALEGGYNYKETITFSHAVTDPAFAIWSLGSPSVPAYFNFTAAEPFNLLGGGPSKEYGGQSIVVDGTAIDGSEGNGIVQFIGTYSSLAFTTPDYESYYALTVGEDQTLTDNPPGATSSILNQVVTPAASTVTWPSPAAITYGTSLSATQLDATSPVAGTFVYNPAAEAVLAVGTHTLAVTFTPADAVDYTSATATVTLQVNQATMICPTLPAMTVSYFTVGETDRDENRGSNGVSNNFVLPALGPHGLPVYNPAKSGSSFVPEDMLSDGEITWWSPTLNNGGTGGTSDVVQTGTATASLPFSNNNFFPPNGTGSSDSNGFQAAVLSGNLMVSTAETVSFSISSDDAAFAYLDGRIVCDDGGLHGAESVPCTTSTISAGTHTLEVFYIDLFNVAAVLDFSATTSNVCINNTPVTPTITWPTPAPIVYGTPLGATQLDATSTVAGTFVYAPPSGTVLPTGVHTLTTKFTPNDLTDFNPATASVQLRVNQATPTIIWPTPAAITYGTALSATQLDATLSVPGTCVYTPVAGTVLSGGTHTLSVTCTPVDTTNYTTATATVMLQVNQVKATITWPTPAPITYGTALSATQLDATFSVPGTCIYTPVAGTVLSGGAQTLSVTCTPKDTTDFAAATATVTLQVNPIKPTIIWPTPAAISYGTPLSATQLDASSSVAGTFVYTPAAGALLTVGTHILSVNFTPTAGADYTTANATVTLQVKVATPAISWPTPAAIFYGTALSSTQLDAITPVVGTFVYTPVKGTVLKVGTYKLSVQFTPTDRTDYTSATASVTLQVKPAAPAIEWPTPAPINVGTALSATQLDASSPVAGTFVYTPGKGTVLPAGTHTLSVIFTPNDTLDYTTAKAAVTILIADFTISASPAIRSVYTGEPASFAVSITGDSGFTLPVALSCEGLPANTTCVFKPAMISGGNGSTALTLQTTAPHRVSNKLVGGTPPGTYTVSIDGQTSTTKPHLIHSIKITLIVKSLF